MSLYDSDGSLALQIVTAANSDHTATAQAVGADGASTWYTLPSPDTVPFNQWCSLLGSNYYLDSTTHTATLLGSDGVTYTFTRDASNNLVIHTNDGEPDTIISSAFLVGERPGRRIHTAGIACNAASFALGFFGAAVALMAISAHIAARGRGGGHITASAVTIEAGMFGLASAVCQNTKW